MDVVSGTLAGVLNPTNGIAEAWSAAQVAEEFEPLPAGTYVCRAESGEPFSSKSGTPGYKVAFTVLEGEHIGRRLWHDSWLTTAALPFSKRDLGKFGITQPEQLDEPFPRGFRCKVAVALRVEDDGRAFNKVRSFDVIGRDELPPVFDPNFPIPRDEALTDTEDGDAIPF